MKVKKRGRPEKPGMVKIGTKLTKETNEILMRASFHWSLTKWEIIEEGLKNLFLKHDPKERRK